MERKYSKGDKVVPHSKNGKNLDETYSCVWKCAKEMNQSYLFVRGYEYDQLLLNHENQGDDGDYYLESDVRLFKEEKKQDSESFIIETQPHIETKLYTYQDGTSDIANVNIEVDTKKVIYSGTTTVVILSDGSKGVAKTSPEDEFDKKKGYAIALRRAYQKRIQKELKELTK